MPRLWLHGLSVYYGHLQGPVTLSPVTSGAVIICFSVFGTCIYRSGIESQFPTCEANALQLDMFIVRLYIFR